MKLFSKILVPLYSKDIANIDLDEFQTLIGKLTSKLLLLHVSTKDSADSNKTLEQLKESLKQSEFEIQVIKESASLPDGVIEVAGKENAEIIMKMDLAAKQPSEEVQKDWGKLIRKSHKSIWIAKQGDRKLPGKIVCPVDFSMASKHALMDAIRLCSIFNAELIILAVYEPMSVSFPTRLEIDYDLENQKLESESRSGLDSFLEGVNFENVKHETHVLQGEPAQQIVDHVQQKQISLVVMGATGKSMLQRIFLGSVTESVMRQLPCSMLIVKDKVATQ